MGQTTTYQLPYPDVTSPRRADQQIKQLADRLEVVLPTSGPTRPAVSYGTSPPGSPADGDLWYLPADATAGVIWAFRYRPGSANAEKWEFVGGPPLGNLVATQESTSTVNSLVNLATVGPRLTVPRTGVYVIEANAAFIDTAADSTVVAAVGIGDFTGSYIFDAITNLSAGNVWSGASFKRVNVALTATQELRMKYQHSAVSTLSVSSRNLSILPIRVS